MHGPSVERTRALLSPHASTWRVSRPSCTVNPDVSLLKVAIDLPSLKESPSAQRERRVPFPIVLPSGPRSMSSYGVVSKKGS